MSDDDKPFACTTPDCGMRFANEDHLIVHMKKHDMCLALNTGSNTLSPNHLFLDQTPTPTKFLRNCEEIGLFQELSKNPFEEAFKKASDVPPFGPGEGHAEGPSTTKNGHPQSAALPGPQPQAQSSKSLAPGPAAALPGPHSNHSEALNTPSTTAVSDMPSQVLKNEPETSVATETGKSPKTQNSSLSSSSNQPTSTTSDDDVIIISNTQAADSSTPTTKTPPVTAVTSSPVIIRLDQPPHVMPVTSSNFGASVVVPQPQYTMQVLLQLPTGQTVPVHIPAAISSPSIHVTAMPVPHTHAPASVAKPSSASPVVTMATPQPQPSLAKQKLKAALQQSAQQNAAAAAQNQSKLISSSSAAATASPPSATPVTTGCATIKTVLQSGLQTLHMAATASSSKPHSTTMSMLDESSDSSFMDMDMDSMVGSPDSLDSVSIGGIKRKREDGDPDDRRRKFLERNRAAAARCRQRRKQWITNLEKKAEELQNTNSRLQGEVNLLRNEVAQLKTLLLAHKDCPITLQQKSQGHLSIQTVSMPVVDSVVIDSADVATAEAIATSALTNMAQGAMHVEAAPRADNSVVIGTLPASLRPKKEV